jgi:hypothetical protein
VKSNGLAVYQTGGQIYTPKFVMSCLTYPRTVEFRSMPTTAISRAKTNTMKTNNATLLVICKKVGLRVNAEEATHSSMSSAQNAVKNVHINQLKCS